MEWKKETFQTTYSVHTRPTWTTVVGLYKVKIEEDLDPYTLPPFQVEVEVVKLERRRVIGGCSFDVRYLRLRTLEEAQFLGERLAQILTEAQQLVDAVD